MILKSKISNNWKHNQKSEQLLWNKNYEKRGSNERRNVLGKEHFGDVTIKEVLYDHDKNTEQGQLWRYTPKNISNIKRTMR